MYALSSCRYPTIIKETEGILNEHYSVWFRTEFFHDFIKKSVRTHIHTVEHPHTHVRYFHSHVHIRHGKEKNIYTQTKVYKAIHDTRSTLVLCLPCVHSLPLIFRTRSLTVVVLIMAMVLVAVVCG